jgi:hypothetical protein
MELDYYINNYQFLDYHDKMISSLFYQISLLLNHQVILVIPPSESVYDEST